MNLKIIVVEDEFSIRMDITRKLTNLGHEIVGSYDNYDQAIVSIIENEPDMLILDINLGGSKSGIDLAQNIDKKFDIPFIFLTASSDAATFAEASKANPMGFIIKPFKLEDLRNNVELAYNNYTALKSKVVSEEIKNDEDSFFVKHNGVFVHLMLDKITHIEAMDNYVKIFADQNRYTLNLSLKDVVSKLPSKKFIRIHKSNAVAIHQIKTIEGNSLYLKNGQTFVIGKTYKDDLLKSINLL